MNEDIDNDKNYQIMELKQRISYYKPYKQKYEDLKEDWKYIKSLLDKEFNERIRLKKENEQLRQFINKGRRLSVKELMDNANENELLKKTIKEVQELLTEEVDLFSDKAIEHDIIAYKELNQFDNKDAYSMCISTKKAIKMLQRCL